VTGLVASGMLLASPSSATTSSVCTPGTTSAADPHSGKSTLARPSMTGHSTRPPSPAVGANAEATGSSRPSHHPSKASATACPRRGARHRKSAPGHTNRTLATTRLTRGTHNDATPCRKSLAGSCGIPKWVVQGSWPHCVSGGGVESQDIPDRCLKTSRTTWVNAVVGVESPSGDHCRCRTTPCGPRGRRELRRGAVVGVRAASPVAGRG
jgi:hypothetical protein